MNWGWTQWLFLAMCLAAVVATICWAITEGRRTRDPNKYRRDQ
jgi:hypothetical protein